MIVTLGINDVQAVYRDVEKDIGENWSNFCFIKHVQIKYNCKNYKCGITCGIHKFDFEFDDISSAIEFQLKYA